MAQDSSPGGPGSTGWTPRYSPLGGNGATGPGTYGAATAANPQAPPAIRPSRHSGAAVPRRVPGAPVGRAVPAGLRAQAPRHPPAAGGPRGRGCSILIAIGVVALLVIGGVAWYALAGATDASGGPGPARGDLHRRAPRPSPRPW